MVDNLARNFQLIKVRGGISSDVKTGSCLLLAFNLLLNSAVVFTN